MESILTSIKKLLGPAEEYDHFDPDIIMHINSVFMILRQMGVGPKQGFSICDDTAEWTDYLPNIEEIEAVKTYIYMKVKLVFDPPTGGVLEMYKEAIKEFEWRLYVEAETPTIEAEEG